MKTNEKDPLVSSLCMIPYVTHCSIPTMAKGVNTLEVWTY